MSFSRGHDSESKLKRARQAQQEAFEAQSKGDVSTAFEKFHCALQLANAISSSKDDKHLEMRMKMGKNCGSLLSNSMDYDGALAFFLKAEGEFLKHSRAKRYLFSGWYRTLTFYIGNAYFGLGRYETSIQVLKRAEGLAAEGLLQGDLHALDDLMCILDIKSKSLRAVNKIQDAVETLRICMVVIDEHESVLNSEQMRKQAELLVSLGLLENEADEFTSASRSFAAGIRILKTLLEQGNPVPLDYIHANVGLGLLYYNRQQAREAIECFNEAIGAGKSCPHDDPEIRKALFSAAQNLHAAHQYLDNTDQAKKSKDLANSYLREIPDEYILDMIPERVTLLLNEVREKISSFDCAAAFELIGEVFDVLYDPRITDSFREKRSDVDLIVADAEGVYGYFLTVCVNAEVGPQIDDAIRLFDSAIASYESFPVESRFYRVLRHAALYEVATRVFSRRSSPVKWFREKSHRFSHLVDLLPSTSNSTARGVVETFMHFHQLCMGVLLDCDVEQRKQFAVRNVLPAKLRVKVGNGLTRRVVPEILSAIQGRTLVAEVLESALAGDADAPEPVRMLALHKQRMREVLEQIREEGEMGLSAGMLGVGGPGGMRGGGFEQPWVPKPSEKSQEALRAELQRLRDDLPKLKEAAAQVEGYEILDAPHTQITTERLQAVLGDGEALALAFTHGGEGTEPLAGEENPDLSEKGYVFVLRNTGEPELTPCAALPGLASRFDLFTESLPAGRMRRGAWDVRGPEGLPSGDAAEVPKAER
ncbi:hypothetical protein JMM61_20525, partial [Rhodovulum sulfidophilum]|uniref:hypothetical protein n=1 Tax=Rhodovulum sulfidophilum TaxID=35806 RepID=UPI0019289FB2